MQAMHEERATVIYGVPTMFIAELDHPEFDRFDFSSLRTGVMAGAPCPIEVMKRVVHRDALSGNDHHVRADGKFAGDHDVVGGG